VRPDEIKKRALGKQRNFERGITRAKSKKPNQIGGISSANQNETVLVVPEMSDRGSYLGIRYGRRVTFLV
jgi:hypothetical protein